MIYYSDIVIYHSEYIIYYTEYIINNHRIHFYYNTSHSIAHYLHIIFKRNIFTCHNIITFCSILIARMAKPAGKTKKTIQTKLGSLAKAGTKGKKRSSSSKTLLCQSAINKRRVEDLQLMPIILLLPLMTMTLILLLTKMMMMMMLSLLVFQVIPFYLCKSCKVKLLMMIWMMMTKMTTMAMAMRIILEWSIMQLFMMEEKTLLLLSIKPDYQPVLAVQILVQVYCS